MSPAADPAGSHVLGNLLVVAAVVSSAGYVVWSRRAAGAVDEGLGLTAWQFAGATVATSPFVAISWLTGGSRIFDARPGEIVAAAVLVCGLVALTAFNNLGIGSVTASRAGVLFSLQPVAGALTAVAVLGEPLGAGQALGGALIALGVLVPSRPAAEDRRPPPNPTDGQRRGRRSARQDLRGRRASRPRRPECVRGGRSCARPRRRIGFAGRGARRRRVYCADPDGSPGWSGGAGLGPSPAVAFLARTRARSRRHPSHAALARRSELAIVRLWLDPTCRAGKD